jgi:autotransporter family porin
MLRTLCLGYGGRVYADCAPSNPAGTYACSGSTTTTQSLSPAPAAAPLVVARIPGFGITTSTGDAFDLSTAAAGTGLGFTDAYVSTISGNGYGINATNLGAGNLTITATGSVSGGALKNVTASGIQAKNYGAGLTISAVGVVGTNYGIGGRVVDHDDRRGLRQIQFGHCGKKLLRR